MPTAGAMRTCVSDRGDAWDTSRGVNAAAIPARIAGGHPAKPGSVGHDLRNLVALMWRGNMGNAARNGLVGSLPSTPSPSWLFGDLFGSPSTAFRIRP